MASHGSDKPWIYGCIHQFASETGQRFSGIFLLFPDKKIIFHLGLSAGENRTGSSIIQD